MFYNSTNTNEIMEGSTIQMDFFEALEVPEEHEAPETSEVSSAHVPDRIQSEMGKLSGSEPLGVGGGQ